MLRRRPCFRRHHPFGVWFLSSSWRHAVANVPPLLPLAASCKPESQTSAAFCFDSCQTFKLTCSIMQVSARPLTLNLLFQFNINGSRNPMAEADALMKSCAVWFHSCSSNLYTCLLDKSVESSIQTCPIPRDLTYLARSVYLVGLCDSGKHRDSATL